MQPPPLHQLQADRASQTSQTNQREREMSEYHQGAKLKRPPGTKPLLIPRETMAKIEYDVKHEAHRLALSHANKPWARRWLRDQRFGR